MEMTKKIAAGWRQVVNSTNGTINIITAVLLALAASLNFPEAPLEGLIAAVVPMLAVVREWLKEGVKFRFSGNVFTYLAAAVVLVAPWLAEFFEFLQPVVDALLRGDIGALWPALLPLINIILYLARERPWEKPDPSLGVPGGDEPAKRPELAPADPGPGKGRK